VAVRRELGATLRDLDNPRSRLGDQARTTATSAMAMAAPTVDKLRPVPKWAWLVLALTAALPMTWLSLASNWFGEDSAGALNRGEGTFLSPLGGGEDVLVVRPPPAPEDPLIETRSRPEVQAALSKRQTGGPEAVVRELGRLYRAEKSPEIAFLLGEAEAMAGHEQSALQHAKVALKGNPKLVQSPGLRAFVLGQLGDRRNGWLAGRIIEDHYALALAGDLARVACDAERRSGRRRAGKILEKTGALERIEPWCQLTVELELAKSCQQRRDVIVRMGKLGDARALPALGRVRRGSKGALFWKKRTNACLRSDLAKTRRILEAAEGSDEPGD